MPSGMFHLSLIRTPPPETLSVCVSPPTGSSMPLTVIGRMRVDARPFAALDALGLAAGDDAQRVRRVESTCRIPPKRWMPRPVLYSTAASQPASRCTRASLTARTSTIAPPSTAATVAGQQADVRQAELDVLAVRGWMGRDAETAIVDQGRSCFASASGSTGSIASREHT